MQAFIDTATSYLTPAGTQPDATKQNEKKDDLDDMMNKLKVNPEVKTGDGSTAKALPTVSTPEIQQDKSEPALPGAYTEAKDSNKELFGSAQQNALSHSGETAQVEPEEKKQLMNTLTPTPLGPTATEPIAERVALNPAADDEFSESKFSDQTSHAGLSPTPKNSLDETPSRDSYSTPLTSVSSKGGDSASNMTGTAFKENLPSTTTTEVASQPTTTEKSALTESPSHNSFATPLHSTSSMASTDTSKATIASNESVQSSSSQPTTTEKKEEAGKSSSSMSLPDTPSKGKVSMGDKISGSIEKMMGKMTHNQEKIEHGQLKKAGEV